MNGNDMPTIGPKSQPAPQKEELTNQQVIRVLGFLILMGTIGIPLTIILWKAATS